MKSIRMRNLLLFTVFRFLFLTISLQVSFCFVPVQNLSGISRLRLFEGLINNDEALPTSLSPLDAIRLNKVFKATYSRRQADKIIQDGRVSVNNEISFGCMVVPYQDVVEIDGIEVKGWEEMNGLTNKQQTTPNNQMNLNSNFEYVKFWKPRGVVCTTDERIENNIIDELYNFGFQPKHRVYPVGRLDKDSSGVILITSDGRLPNASLRRSQKQSKVYQVRVDRPLYPEDIQYLRDGVVITTIAQRDGKSKSLTAPTMPCLVKPLRSTDCCEMTLQEGRNRQIRKMMTELGYRVRNLHRVKFGKIGLDGLEGPGKWKRLNQSELQWIEELLQQGTDYSKVENITDEEYNQ